MRKNFQNALPLVISQLWIFILTVSQQSMVKLKCNDYGFECDFAAEGDMNKVVEEFRAHTDTEHGIDYSKEAIMQFLKRKQES